MTENETYRLTEHCILYETLKDFRVDVGIWNNTYWKAIYYSFMKNLEKAGYIEKTEPDDSNYDNYEDDLK